jgi:hypothetical protein
MWSTGCDGVQNCIAVPSRANFWQSSNPRFSTNRQYATTVRFAEEHQASFDAPREGGQLEEVLERIRSLPDERQQEIAQVLLAYLDEEDSDFSLSPEQIAEIERRAADDGPYATDEEVREVFARLAK